jgi:hypothetical protein
VTKASSPIHAISFRAFGQAWSGRGAILAGAHRIPIIFDDKNGVTGNHKELHVSCVPDLPENVFIDEKNHIYVHVNIPFDRTMLDQEDVDVWLGKRCFKI